jgi:hypothetical protein
MASNGFSLIAFDAGYQAASMDDPKMNKLIPIKYSIFKFG